MMAKAMPVKIKVEHMTHCKDCKWWAKDYVQQHWSGFPDLVDWGKCGLADDSDNPLDCDGDNEREVEFIYAFAGEHYDFAFVQTRATFGCVLFDARDKKDPRDRKFVHRPQLDGGDYEVEA